MRNKRINCITTAARHFFCFALMKLVKLVKVFVYNSSRCDTIGAGILLYSRHVLYENIIYMYNIYNLLIMIFVRFINTLCEVTDRTLNFRSLKFSLKKVD